MKHEHELKNPIWASSCKMSKLNVDFFGQYSQCRDNYFNTYKSGLTAHKIKIYKAKVLN